MSNKEKVGAKNEDSSRGTTENIATKTIAFFNQYQNLVYGVLIALMLIIIGIMAAGKFYFQPKNERGAIAILPSITQYTEGIQTNDTAKLITALEGDGVNDGFEFLCDNYKMTKIGNSAKYFAGMTHYALGNRDEALDYLRSFKKKDHVYWYAAQMTLGDIYDDLDEKSKATGYYKKAAKGDNSYYTPIALFKLGQMQEEAGQWKEAYDSYAKIKANYYKEYESMGIDRFLEHAGAKAGK